jgi:NAD(P)-dependent dehydrogenase (short-subunit alcohol dehydrogenase family)
MAQPNKSPVAVVTGVGPGLGGALVRRFARGGYAVAMIARSREFIDKLGAELKAEGARTLAVTADMTAVDQVNAAFATVRSELGAVDVLLYNAGSAAWGNVTEISSDQFEQAWRVNALGAFVSAKAAVPDMAARGSGAILFTGATAGIKAGARSVAFGPAKFAMRGLAQSLARDLGPRGIHVAWVNVDGIIDIPRVRARMPNLKDEDLLKPAAIAETYWHLAHQDRSAWSLELEVRPFKEKF